MPKAAKATQDRAWDADALIGWLGEEPEKRPLCEPVIRAAESGHIRIIVSTLATAEVVKLRHHTPISRENQQRIVEFFLQDYIMMRNLDPRTADLARLIVWDQAIAPKDAVHVATALHAGVELLNTFDGGLLKKSPLEIDGFKPLRIAKPHVENYQPRITEGN